MEDDPLRDRLAVLAARLGVAPSQLLVLLVLPAVGLAAAAAAWWPQIAPPPVAAPVLVDAPSEEPTAAATSDEPLVVHVTGAVRAAGLVELAPGARVADAIDAAGGAHDDAVVDALNLARPVVDGEQLRVPLAGEELDLDVAAGPDAFLPDGRLDINRATATDLETLPGVGPVLAGRIVAHRDTNGAFASPGDLRQVSGIGERTFQAMADLVVVP